MLRSRAEELRQNTILSFTEGPQGPGTPEADVPQKQAQHVIDILRTELQALNVKVQEQDELFARKDRDLKGRLDKALAELRAAEIKRDDMHVKCIEAVRGIEQLTEDKLQLQVHLHHSCRFSGHLMHKMRWIGQVQHA
jgi:hypothetical protein